MNVISNAATHAEGTRHRGERWVILVSPSGPAGYLGLMSDEDDDQDSPPRTADPDLAIDYATHVDAVAACKSAVERWPEHAFMAHLLAAK